MRTEVKTTWNGKVMHSTYDALLTRDQPGCLCPRPRYDALHKDGDTTCAVELHRRWHMSITLSHQLGSRLARARQHSRSAGHTNELETKSWWSIWN